MYMYTEEYSVCKCVLEPHPISATAVSKSWKISGRVMASELATAPSAGRSTTPGLLGVHVSTCIYIIVLSIKVLYYWRHHMTQQGVKIMESPNTFPNSGNLDYVSVLINRKTCHTALSWCFPQTTMTLYSQALTKELTERPF